MPSARKLNRDVRIDFLRVLLMLGITMLHVASKVGADFEWLNCLLHPCVTAFAFISGWFGCRCRLSKFVALYGTAIFCATVMTTVLMQSPYVATEFGKTWMPQFFRMLKNYWFLHAYAFMMLFAPLIDHAVAVEYSKENEKLVIGRIMPVAVLSFGWSFLATFRFTELWLPRPAGLGAYTGLTLVGTYALARYCRWSGCLDRISGGIGCVAFVLACALSVVKLGRYNSPVALAWAALAFKGLKSVNAEMFFERCRRMIVYLAPSMFSVYLLQVNDFMFPFLADCGEKLRAFLPGCVCVGVLTIGCFVACLAVDILRRCVLNAVVWCGHCMFRRGQF